MKANELMIGDWVLTLESTHKEKIYAQIWAIEEGQTSILVKKDICNWFVDIEWIEPIPLTTEILGKNVEQRTISGWYAIAKGVRIRPAESGYRVIIGLTELPLQIFYVHQLQHILRLWGIEKDIEL